MFSMQKFSIYYDYVDNLNVQLSIFSGSKSEYQYFLIKSTYQHDIKC